MKALSITLICLSTLLLLCYPLVLMGNVMAYANLPSGDPQGSLTALHAFFWSSTLYPLAWLAALVFSIWNLKKDYARKAVGWQAGLVLYVILTTACLLSV